MHRLLLTLLFCPCLAMAQAFPVKPVRIIVPFPAGGTTDIVARAIAQKLTDGWKQPVIVDNRPGGGANIGAEAAAKSAPDGYTLFIASTAHSINASLYPRLAYDPVRDFARITLLAVTASVLVLHPSVPANNVQELVALLKARPDAFNYASAGNGSLPHLAAEMFKSMTGTQMVHVPYKGGPQAMTDLLAGQVSLTFATAPQAVPHIRAGKLKVLGVSTVARVPALPDVPTMTEAGLPGFQASNFHGLVGPAGVPAAIVRKIHEDVVRVVREPEMSKYLGEQGADPVTNTPAEYDAQVRDEVAAWAKVVRASGAKID